MGTRKDDDDDSMGAVYRFMRREQQERRAKRLPVRVQEIMDLEAKGFGVRKLTDYQFRIDGKLDLFPIHRRFHHLATGKRGCYQDAAFIVATYCGGGA